MLMVAPFELTVHEFKSYELSEDTSRKGLIIREVGRHGLSFARCYEGFRLSPDCSVTDEVIELDVFDMDFVGVNKAARRKGLGTQLIQHVFSEADIRGFSVVRFEAASPRTISIVDKLRLGRSILNAHYVATPAITTSSNGMRRTTQEILEDPTCLHAAEAKDFLYSLPLDEDEMNFREDSAKIECVVRI
jgi:GNAT superfamily N-acetyltransferase